MASKTTRKLPEELKAQRTGIAYAMEDVEKYIVALAQGSKTPRPKPVKRTRKS